jgi:actin-related protein
MHQMHVALELKDQELQGLKTALESKKKRSKKKKVLPLSPRDPNVQGGALFWDPASKARADRRMRDAERQEIAEEVAKVSRKRIRYNSKLLREKTKTENKEKAARKREDSAQKRAQEDREKQAQKAEKERVRELKNAQKVSKSPKQVSSKASKKSQSKYRSVVVVQRGVVHRWCMSPAPHPKALRHAVAASHVLQTN